MSKRVKKKSETYISMKISVIEGIFAQIHSTITAIGNVFITKIAVILNANPMQFSLLTGITQFTQFFQLYAVLHNRNINSRKAACINFAFWGRLINILVCCVLVVNFGRFSYYIFLLILFFSATLQVISGNMWVAWISDLIPKEIRGRFFSVRMQIHLVFGLIIGYICSFFIDLFEVPIDSIKYNFLQKLNLTHLFIIENQKIAIAIIFIIGVIFGIFGLFILKKQHEKPIINKSNEKFSLFEPLKNKNFRSLLRFGIWWMFAIGIGSAFWSPFMIKELKMSLVEIQVYNMLSSIFMLLSFRLWGKFIDRFGNKTAMKICVFLGAFNPSLWIFFHENNYSLIWLEGITSGIMWSGANLIAFNFVLAIAPKGKEQHWSAVYSAFGGVVMLLSILLSGLFFPSSIKIFNLNLKPEQVLFGVTGVLRLSAEIPLYFVNEIKAVPLRKTLYYTMENLYTKIMRLYSKIKV
jgi:Na+/melibiose symporter-like transporter